MATITTSAALGSKHTAGRNVRVNDSGAVADVTVSFDSTKVKTKGDLLEACRAIIQSIGADLLT